MSEEKSDLSNCVTSIIRSYSFPKTKENISLSFIFSDYYAIKKLITLIKKASVIW